MILGGTPLFFDKTPGSSTPLAYNEAVANETSTAQSPDVAAINAGAAKREGISQAVVDAFVNRAPSPTPQNPAGAQPESRPKNVPLILLGVAVVGALLFFVGRKVFS